ncbi:hypothetical protein CNEO4_140098 [Clostridium neonatale]|uniref:Uncharacterized protein n=1 Tax=Clostridium neonatale TaxID=137838 RepID=A0AAD1YBB9_9CLOT|nr:hypothetical protein CNEO2_120053 [Clostridium neonatale]CAI3198205.1 hypothetical protein CNEO2_170052 [Clostridium neonatale]CAI3214765.1 hypothetical protein CNEO2_730020 [Clostridium neonatale]CAI3235182.1 hypothetical protein CNEO2_230020 [Clostridium neonatale]CAI3235536.1 hypothetical protein CNEO2_240020 [Clostridium neonatale]
MELYYIFESSYCEFQPCQKSYNLITNISNNISAISATLKKKFELDHERYGVLY